jgi:hypothetical protein
VLLFLRSSFYQSRKAFSIYLLPTFFTILFNTYLITNLLGIWEGQRWILSQADAGERMVRSGDVQETSSLATSIASATCTVAATVQESLWKLQPPSMQLPRPWLHQ